MRQVARVVESDCLFAHVRAATGGSPVSRLNCHPFSFGNLTFIHNGLIPEFGRMKRRLLERLSDETYDSLAGATDSEHIFALFCENYRGGGLEGMAEGLLRTISQLDIQRQCFLNFALTDGNMLVSTRCISDGWPTLCITPRGKISLQKRRLHPGTRPAQPGGGGFGVDAGGPQSVADRYKESMTFSMGSMVATTVKATMQPTKPSMRGSRDLVRTSRPCSRST